MQIPEKKSQLSTQTNWKEFAGVIAFISLIIFQEIFNLYIDSCIINKVLKKNVAKNRLSVTPLDEFQKNHLSNGI